MDHGNRLKNGLTISRPTGGLRFCESTDKAVRPENCRTRVLCTRGQRLPARPDQSHSEIQIVGGNERGSKGSEVQECRVRKVLSGCTDALARAYVCTHWTIADRMVAAAAIRQEVDRSRGLGPAGLIDVPLSTGSHCTDGKNQRSLFLEPEIRKLT